MLERQAEVRSEDQGTQKRSGLFHSWYTDPSLQHKGEQCSEDRDEVAATGWNMSVM